MSEDEYRREELIREIERRVEQMTLRQLEALQYELETASTSFGQTRGAAPTVGCKALNILFTDIKPCILSPLRSESVSYVAERQPPLIKGL